MNMKINVNTSEYSFPEIQETEFIEWDNVIKQITSNKQSKQRINYSNELYEQFMKNNRFLDETLSLKRDIINSAIEQYIDINLNRYQIRKPDAETVILYNNNQKINEQAIAANTLSEADLQDKASRAAERACAEMIYNFYNKPVLMQPNSENLSTCQLIEYGFEKYGANTAPDLYFKFQLKTNNDEEFELNTLLEVKSVLSTVKPDKTIEVKYNNATNSKNVVINDLNVFKDKDVFMNRNGNIGENSNRTKIYSTLTCFIYYYPDNKNHNIVFYDYDLIWFPMTLEFDISPKNGKITDKIFKVKSNGENSVNNNVNLSLSTPAGIYEKQDILFNRLLLYLTGHIIYNGNLINQTDPYNLDLYMIGNTHLLTKYEMLVNGMLFNSIVLKAIMGKKDDINKENIRSSYDIFNRTYKSIQKSIQNAEFRSDNSDTNIEIIHVYEQSKEYIKVLKKLYKHTKECVSIENDIKELLDIQDSMTYNDFKYACDHIRKRWNNVKKISDKLCDRKDIIQESINMFKTQLKIKKKLMA